MNVLIVNDDAIAIAGMAKGIDWRECGVEGDPQVAYSAAQALALLEENAADILLCDIEMPGGSGIDLVRAVRERYPDIDCVFLTCHAKFEYAQAAIKLGCANYILTPAPYAAIADEVKAAAKRVAQRRETRMLQTYGEQVVNERFLEADNDGKAGDPERIVYDIEAYIIENISDSGLTVQGLARSRFMNEDYLSRLFKRERGVSLNRFIIQQRMDLAARLLSVSELTASAIAVKCGYASYPHFISAFKRHFGCTPTKYRKENNP